MLGLLGLFLRGAFAKCACSRSAIGLPSVHWISNGLAPVIRALPRSTLTTLLVLALVCVYRKDIYIQYLAQ